MKITFSCNKRYLNFVEKEDLPCPASNVIEGWYKKMKYDKLNRNLKNCMPFLDGMMAGYVLKLPQNFQIYLNKTNLQTNSLEHEIVPSLQNNVLPNINLNAGLASDYHSVNQVKDSPYLTKNGNTSIFKILNPWTIKTPNGYSTLFIPPIGSKEDRFHIIPAIVDTDTFTSEVNFPIVFNTDKYNIEYKGVLEKSTPYVQLIPFKRDAYKMKIESETSEVREKKIFNFMTNSIEFYKNKIRQKKIWK